MNDQSTETEMPKTVVSGALREQAVLTVGALKIERDGAAFHISDGRGSRVTILSAAAGPAGFVAVTTLRITYPMLNPSPDAPPTPCGAGCEDLPLARTGQGEFAKDYRPAARGLAKF